MSNNVRSITEPRRHNPCEACTFVLGTFFPEGVFTTGPLGVDIFIHPSLLSHKSYEVVFIKEDGLFCGCIHHEAGKLNYKAATSRDCALGVEAFMRQTHAEYSKLFNTKHKEIRSVMS